MKCICGSKDNFISKIYTNNFTIKGKVITFDSERKFCSSCSEIVYDAELDNLTSKKAIDLYNRKYGIMPEEITTLRKKLGLSIELFSLVIGCAKKTLISYENGSSIPNDSYMVTIKMLLASPECIINMIEASKDRFTEKLYTKLTTKVYPIFGENAMQLLNTKNYIPSEFNGYTGINYDKIKNVIIHLCSGGINKTKLLKEIFYSDFLFYKSNAYSITGFAYAKLQYGPVPDDFNFILDNLISKGTIESKIEYNGEFETHILSSKENERPTVLLQSEKEVLDKVSDFFKKYSTSEIVNFSHNEKAWIETNDYKLISYDYAFKLQEIK